MRTYCTVGTGLVGQKDKDHRQQCVSPSSLLTISAPNPHSLARSLTSHTFPPSPLALRRVRGPNALAKPRVQRPPAGGQSRIELLSPGSRERD